MPPHPSEALQVDVASRPTADVITVSGDLDLSTANVLRQVLFDPDRRQHRLMVIDLNGLRFIDSSGIGVLVAARRWVELQSGRIVLACEGDRQPGKALRMVGLDQVFEIVDTADDIGSGPAR